MLTLTLLRHAKSNWDDPSLEDFDRPLGRRGRDAAPKMGEALAARGLKPDLIICSGAVRARQTLELVVDAFGSPTPHVVFDDAVYMATPQVLLARLRAHTGSEAPGHVMIVGHNPGLEELALQLAVRGPADERGRMAEKFPTASAAVIAFNADDWSDVGPGSGKLELFLTPKQLT